MQSDVIKKGNRACAESRNAEGHGLTDADLARPLVAVANTWSEITPCNFHLRSLAEKVKEGIRAAGGTPIECNTIVDFRWNHHGNGRHEGLSRIARSDRRFDRAFRAFARLRCRGRDLRLRQNNSRHGDGSRPAESARPFALRRLDHARGNSTGTT